MWNSQKLPVLKATGSAVFCNEDPGRRNIKFRDALASSESTLKAYNCFNGLEGVMTFSHLLKLLFINLCVIFQPGSSRNAKKLYIFFATIISVKAYFRGKGK